MQESCCCIIIQAISSYHQSCPLRLLRQHTAHLPAERRNRSSPLTTAFLRPQSRLVWLAVRAHQGTPLVRAGACSATARAKSACVAGGPGDFAIISLARPPSHSPPTLSCFLPPSQSFVFCHRLSGDPQIPVRTHTQTWKCVFLLRNYMYLHHWTLSSHLCRRDSSSSPPSSNTAGVLRSRCYAYCHVISVTPVHSAACLPTRPSLASATYTDCIHMHELSLRHMTADWSNV